MMTVVFAMQHSRTDAPPEVARMGASARPSIVQRNGLGLNNA
jgi:hypothetical protein